MERLADRLRPLVGRWVAIKDDDILHAADIASYQEKIELTPIDPRA